MIPTRLVLPCILSVLAPTGVAAQATFEFHGGVASTSYRGDGVGSDAGASTGLVVGAAVRIDVGPSIRVRSGLEYVRRGGDLGFGFGPGPMGDELVERRLDRDYLVIPVTAELRGSLGAVEPFASVGPEMAVEVSCSIDETVFLLDDFGRIVGEESRDGLTCGDGTKGVLFGLRAGGGVEFPVSESTSLVLRGHYLLGLTDAFDRSAPASPRLQSFEASVGIVF